MIKASSFNKAGACSSRSGFYEQSKASRSVDETIIIKDFCKDILSKKYVITSQQDLIDEVAACYSDDVLDEIEETQESNARKIALQIWRYGKSQLLNLKKDDEIVIPEEPFIIDISHMIENDFVDSDQIEVKIDAIIINKVEKEIQGIVFKRGTPKLGTTERAYQRVATDIPLHLINYTLEKMADSLFSKGTEITVTSSYYHMKKTSDTSKTVYYVDYFSTGEPTRNLINKYTIPAPTKYGTDKYPYSKATSDMLDLVNKWATGFDKCDMKEAEDCEGCPDYCMCYYSLAPQRVENSGTKKKRAKVTPTKEQEAIINAREGIFLCNAVPGSGKTETAIKQRTVSIVLEELERIMKKAEKGEDISEYLNPVNSFITKDSRRVDPDLVLKEDLPDDLFG